MLRAALSTNKNLSSQLKQCMKLSTTSVSSLSAQASAVEPQRNPDILYTGVG